MTTLKIGSIYRVHCKDTDDSRLEMYRNFDGIADGIYIALKETNDSILLANKEKFIKLNQENIESLKLEVKSARISEEYRNKLKELYKKYQQYDKIVQRKKELEQEEYKLLNEFKSIQKEITATVDKTLTKSDLDKNILNPNKSAIFMSVQHSNKTIVTIDLSVTLGRYVRESDYDFIFTEYDYTLHLDYQQAIKEVGIKYNKKEVETFIKNELKDIKVYLDNVSQDVTLGDKNKLSTGLVLKLEVKEESKLDYEKFYSKLNNIVKKLDSLF